MTESELFEKNIAFLSIAAPSLATLIQQMASNNHDVKVIPTKSGRLSLLFRGKAVHSTYDPISEAQRICKPILDSGDKTAVILGFGLGYVPALLADAGIPEIHVVEPYPQILAAAARTIDLSQLLGKKQIVLHQKPEEMFFVVGYKVGMEPSLSIAILPAYAALDQEMPRRIRVRIDVLTRNSDLMAQTSWVKNKVWFDHMVENFSNLKKLPGVENLSGLFQGMPGILVAAGPSLDRTAPHLSKAANRSLIVSVGTALKKLAAINVDPDFGIALESNDITAQFDGLQRLPFLAMHCKCYPPLFQLPAPGIFVFGNPTDDIRTIFRWLGKEQSLIASGGSVSCAAFSLLVLAGCNPIILTGLDLSFGEKGQSHADGVETGGTKGIKDEDISALNAEDRTALLAHGLDLVSGYFGKPVITRINLQNYLLWFEKNTRIARESGIEIINATEGGAKIEDTVQMMLSDAIDKYCAKSLDIKEMIRDACRPSDADTVAGSLEAKDWAESAREVSRISRKILSHAESGLKELKRNNLRPHKVDYHVQAIASLEKELDPPVSKIDSLLSVVCNKENFITITAFNYQGLEQIEAFQMNFKQTALLHRGLSNGADLLADSLCKYASALKSS